MSVSDGVTHKERERERKIEPCTAVSSAVTQSDTFTGRLVKAASGKRLLGIVLTRSKPGTKPRAPLTPSVSTQRSLLSVHHHPGDAGLNDRSSFIKGLVKPRR